jgi:hypothetical protein
MTTKLEGSLRREIAIQGVVYTLTIDPRGMKLVPKGKRNGFELSWEAMVSGDAALATALTAMLAKAPSPRRTGNAEAQTVDAAAPPVERHTAASPSNRPVSAAVVSKPKKSAARKSR